MIGEEEGGQEFKINTRGRSFEAFEA